MQDLTLEEFDSMLEAEEEAPVKHHTTAEVDNLVYNNEVAMRLAMGQSKKRIAADLGISQATLYNRMKQGAMKDLVKINMRRILTHLPTRDLRKEKFLSLATAANYLSSMEERMNNADMGPQTRTIDQTFIQQINLHLHRSESEGTSLPHSGEVTEITAEEIPELPEEFEQAGSGETPGPDDRS